MPVAHLIPGVQTVGGALPPNSAHPVPHTGTTGNLVPPQQPHGGQVHGGSVVGRVSSGEDLEYDSDPGALVEDTLLDELFFAPRQQLPGNSEVSAQCCHVLGVAGSVARELDLRFELDSVPRSSMACHALCASFLLSSQCHAPKPALTAHQLSTSI